MPRAKNKKAGEAERLYQEGLKLKDIASRLGLPEGTVRRWKSTYKWGSERSEKKANVRNKGGAPKGNQNAAGHGAPQKNNNAEKFGFFRKYLPEEAVSIMEEMPEDPLDILWHEIQIAYAAIIRAQQIMYVQDRDDKTVEKVEKRKGKIIGEKWEVQQAWDKQGNFLAAQARAMSDLRSSIRQYEELLHKNWELATEEQKARIEKIRAETERIKGETPDTDAEDDGFMSALKQEATKVWEGD